MQKLISNIVFLPMILFIGGITVYEDYKISRIRNRWVSIGLLYAVGVYLLAVVAYYVIHIQWATLRDLLFYMLFLFDRWCINLVISIIVAYCLWHFNLWGAGDAKLFICYAALIPIGQYQRVYFNAYFASFMLLLAIFIPATVFIFLKLIIYGIRIFSVNKIIETSPKIIKEKIGEFNKKKWSIAKMFIGFCAIFMFSKVLRGALQNGNSKILFNNQTMMALCLLAFRPLTSMFRKNFVLVVILGLGSLLLGRFSLPEIQRVLLRGIVVITIMPLWEKVIDIYVTEKKENMPFAIWIFLGVLIVWVLR